MGDYSGGKKIARELHALHLLQIELNQK